MSVFSIVVRDRIMVAHSLPGEVFGPAQRLHGATFAVDATLRRPDLSADGIVADLGAAASVLREVLAPLDYRNLDDLPAFAGVVTTSEVLARHIADALADAIHAGALGEDGRSLAGIAVLLHETPTTSARYERTL